MRLGITAEVAHVSCKPIQRFVDLRNDAGERRFGCERIRDQRHMDAVRERPFRNEAKRFLRAHLPVAAVDEHEHRAALRLGRKVIDAISLALAVTQIEVARMGGRERSAAPVPIAQRSPRCPRRRRCCYRRHRAPPGPCLDRRPRYPNVHPTGHARILTVLEVEWRGRRVWYPSLANAACAAANRATGTRNGEHET